MQLFPKLTSRRPTNSHAFCVILTNFSLWSHKHFFPNVTQIPHLSLYSSITQTIQYHRTHINTNFQIKNVESIHHWHPGKTISCNLAPSQTRISSLTPNLAGPSRKHYIYTILTQMNNQMLAGLTLQEAKSSKSLPLKFSYVKVFNQPKYL